MKESIIGIEIVRHSETGMYLAMSEDMRGLYVHARTIESLNERIPVAIRDILEAEGKQVASVQPLDDAPVEGFAPIRRRFQLEEAA